VTPRPGAALLLDHLHQHHLPALDDLLILYCRRCRNMRSGTSSGVSTADGLDDLLLPSAP
jgi:hypothetical protein